MRATKSRNIIMSKSISTLYKKDRRGNTETEITHDFVLSLYTTTVDFFKFIFKITFSFVALMLVLGIYLYTQNPEVLSLIFSWFWGVLKITK